MTSICKNCDGDRWTPLFQVSDFDSATSQYWLGKCSGCGLIATMDVSDDVLADAYSKQYYGSSGAKFSWLMEWWLKVNSHRTAGSIRDRWTAGHGQAPSPKVLDIGCGRGVLLRAFQSLGAQVLGLERPQFPLDQAVEHYIKFGSLTDAEYDDFRFDIVIFWHVLEHIDEVNNIIRSVNSHLNEDGLLVIAVPNFDSFQRRLFKESWFHLDIPRHLNHFNKSWLIECMANHGINTVSVSTFDFTQNIYGFIQSALNRMFPGRPNELYGLLKYGATKNKFIKLIPWLSLAIIVLPFAVLESIYSAATGQGATLIINARKRS